MNVKTSKGASMMSEKTYTCEISLRGRLVSDPNENSFNRCMRCDECFLRLRRNFER